MIAPTVLAGEVEAQRIEHTAPNGRRAPAHVLRALRQIDPSAELLYFGEGRWVLGTVRDTPQRRAFAARTLEGESRKAVVNLSLVMLAKVAAQGFAPVADYTFVGEPDMSVWHDFAERDWNYRLPQVEQEQLMAEKFHAIDSESRADHQVAVLQDKIASDAKSIHDYVFRGKRSVVMGGSDGR